MNQADKTKKERIQKYGEVFTPLWMVEQMCDALDAENGGEAFMPEKTFLEPTCGDGVFVLEILRRKFRRCRRRSDYTEALLSVWAMDIQERNVTATIESVRDLCREYFKPTKEELQIIESHVIMCDSLKVMQMMNELNEREEKRHGKQATTCGT